MNSELKVANFQFKIRDLKALPKIYLPELNKNIQEDYLRIQKSGINQVGEFSLRGGSIGVSGMFEQDGRQQFGSFLKCSNNSRGSNIFPAYVFGRSDRGIIFANCRGISVCTEIKHTDFKNLKNYKTISKL